METLLENTEAIFPGQIELVSADMERMRTMAKFSLMAAVELPVTHLALFYTTKQDGGGREYSCKSV